jgi:hypothetical protein
MINRTLFVHAGGPKTGSSALQNFFEINASRLQHAGFSYENRLNIKYNYEINSGNGILLYDALSSATTTDNEVDSILLSYFGRCTNAICSSEFFAEFGAHEWKKLFESSMRLDVKLKVLFYVRNIIPYFLSGYDQMIKRHGECILFDEWIVKPTWQHGKALRTILQELPQSSLLVLHFDRERSSLIRGFLDNIGVDALFEVDIKDQKRQVNRSLTDAEREALKTVNRFLGNKYSMELSDLLIYADPNAQAEPVSCSTATTRFLIDRYNNEVDWVNKTFFHGQAIVSVFPIEPIKRPLRKKIALKPAFNSNLEKQVLEWALEKIKTIKDETDQRILNTLSAVAQNDSWKLHPEIPTDFDLLAYLILNPDVLHADVDPIQHYFSHGKEEGRAYKFLKADNP